MLAHALHMVGGPVITVTPCFTMDSTAETGSKRSIINMVAPTANVRPRTTLSPKMWNIGSTAKTTSPGLWLSPGAEIICERLLRRLPWLIIAALGDPAVPEVNTSTARSSSSRSTMGPGSPATSSSRCTPPTGSNPQPITTSRSGSSEASIASRTSRAVGPSTTPRAPTAASWCWSSRGGLVGLSGTATSPLPSAAR